MEQCNRNSLLQVGNERFRAVACEGAGGNVPLSATKWVCCNSKGFDPVNGGFASTRVLVDTGYQRMGQRLGRKSSSKEKFVPLTNRERGQFYTQASWNFNMPP